MEGAAVVRGQQEETTNECDAEDGSGGSGGQRCTGQSEGDARLKMRAADLRTAIGQTAHTERSALSPLFVL